MNKYLPCEISCFSEESMIWFKSSVQCKIIGTNYANLKIKQKNDEEGHLASTFA
jgi:hypothetical protein